VRREVHEETGLDIEVVRVLGVASRHFTGPSPRGELEDFHGLHVVYDAKVTSPTDEPRVVEVDGTTDDVAWQSVDDVRARRLKVAAVVVDALGWAAEASP
jgi:ADP-ribose pyrophosphatase YjhB (NUDIX family)